MACAARVKSIFQTFDGGEAPTLLVPSIINHIKSNAPGEHRNRFRKGRKEAQEVVQNFWNVLATPLPEASKRD